MNEDFVPFELAIKLKEKGYPQKTAGRYNMIDCFYYEDGKLFFHGGACDVNEAYTAPTISQVLKWLREEKELHIEIYMYNNYYSWEIYNTKIYDADFTQKRVEYSDVDYETYEQAALAGIEYVLDNLI